MRRLILIALLAVALVAALAACGGSGGGTETTPATPAPTTMTSGGATSDKGAAIWNAECADCHAADPAGVGVADAKQVQNVVENGVEGMPAFAGKLSAADIKAVSRYVAKAAQ